MLQRSLAKTGSESRHDVVMSHTTPHKHISLRVWYSKAALQVCPLCSPTTYFL